jgi:biopolymer transport protein ExbD
MMKKNMVVILMIFAIISMACTVSGISIDVNRTEGSGILTKEERQLNEFSEIALAGIGNLYIVQGDENKVIIEAEDNILPKLTTNIQGDKLTIGVERGMNILPTQEINYYITMVEINDIQMLGAGNVKVTDLETDKLSMKLTGFGSMDIKNLSANTLDVMISGAGDVNIAGEVNRQKINITGAGNYNAEDLLSQTATVTVSGLGNSNLWVEEDLSVVISGGGNINYYGNPKTNRTITGLGKLSSRGEHY